MRTRYVVRGTRVVQESRGLGDVVARLAGRLGFTSRPGCGCARRQAWLNQALPFARRSSGLYAPVRYARTIAGGSPGTTYTVKAGGGGDFTTIQACANTAVAGDTCRVFAGTYAERPTLPTSGSVGLPITFDVNSGDTVIMQGFVITGRSYITIGGPTTATSFEITSAAAGNIGLGSAANIIIQNNYIHAGGAPCIKNDLPSASKSTYVTIRGNNITQCGDVPTVPQQGIYANGDHWLIDANTFSHLEDGIAIYGSNHVVRNNEFGPLTASDYPQDGSVHPDMIESHGAIGDLPFTRSLIEGNWGHDWRGVHTHVALMRDTNALGAGDIIWRHNAWATVGIFSIDTTDFTNHRIYNNSFSNIGVDHAPKDFNDLTFTSGQNPKLFNNIFANAWREDSSDACYGPTLATSGIGNYNLCFLSGWTGAWQSPGGPGYGANDIFNTDPLFVDATANLHLQSSSPARQAGTAVTTVAGTDTGSGTSLIVNDAGFFTDGFGIVNADWLRVGASTTVQISAINYGTNTITLANAISRSVGDPVYLYKNSSGTVVLSGAAPDLGAYEFVAPQSPATARSSGGRIVKARHGWR